LVRPTAAGRRDRPIAAQGRFRSSEPPRRRQRDVHEFFAQQAAASLGMTIRT